MAAGWLTHNDLHSDTWNYHNAGLVEYHLLFTNPKEYFTNLFYTGYSYGYHGILQTQNSFWNDLKDNLIIKLVSVLHIFSGGNYYINVVLYNFIIFFGGIGLYRVFKQVYQSNKLLTAVVVFLLPSVLFFGSAIHKDGLVMALIGLVVFNIWQLLLAGFTFKRVVFIFLPFLLIFFFRNFVAMALLPALAAWIISQKKNIAPYKTFIPVYTAALLLFFTIQYLLPSVNLQAYMVQKQADFFSLEKGNTSIQMDTLQATPASFISIAPKAMEHGLLRPFITDARLSKMLLPLGIELVFYEILVVLFLFFRRQHFTFNHPFIFFSLFFGLSLCLIIGYTVPVIGAIVRYRSIYLPFIIAPFILGTDWDKLITFAKIKK